MPLITQRTKNVIQEALADLGAANEVLSFLRGSGIAISKTMTLPVGYNVALCTTGASAPIVLTLPTAASSRIGAVVTVIKVDTGAQAVTVTAAGTDLINGSATYSVAATQYKRVGLVSDGSSNWYVVNAN